MIKLFRTCFLWLNTTPIVMLISKSENDLNRPNIIWPMCISFITATWKVRSIQVDSNTMWNRKMKLDLAEYRDKYRNASPIDMSSIQHFPIYKVWIIKLQKPMKNTNRNHIFVRFSLKEMFPKRTYFIAHWLFNIDLQKWPALWLQKYPKNNFKLYKIRPKK